MAGADGSHEQQIVNTRNRKAPKTRHDGWTAHRRRLFIQVLRGTLNVSAAARAVGMSARGAHELRRRDTMFCRDWDLAIEDAQIELRFELMRHALKGTETQVMLIEGTGRQAVTRWTRVKRSAPINLMLRLLQKPEILRSPEQARPPGQQSMQRIKAQIDAVRLRIGIAPLRWPELISVEDGPDDERQE